MKDAGLKGAGLKVPGSLDALMVTLGYRFLDVALLKTALRHASYQNEHPAEGPDNERLEFLGDSVMGAVVSHLLYRRFPELPEGRLTRLKAILVSETGLVPIAQALGLGDYLALGRGEERGGGRERRSLLANAVEAVLAAVYLDGGFAAVEALTCRLFEPRLAGLDAGGERVDYKTALQERLAADGGATPTYRVVSVSGPDHQREYVCEVSAAGAPLAQGQGRSKKAAEQAAAARATQVLVR